MGLINKLENAAGIAPTNAEAATKMPYGKGEYIKSGEKARPWTGKLPRGARRAYRQDKKGRRGIPERTKRKR